MRKLIIVEGPDRTGKTTLAKFLALKFNAFYIHMSGNSTLHIGMEAYHQEMLRYITFNVNNGHIVVLDRCWLSEFIYGMHFRPQISSKFPFNSHQEWLKMLGGLYIICENSNAVKNHTEDSDPDHPYSEKDFSKIVDGYRSWYLRNMGPNVIHYDMDEYGHKLGEYAELVRSM